MLKAAIKGKIPSKLDTSEDLLTSNIFGCFDYVTDQRMVIPILENSMNLKQQPIKIDGHIKEMEFFFWPRLSASEPDVVISLKTNTDNYIILVEVKYNSGKSGEDDELSAEEEAEEKEDKAKFYDQLAREYSDLLSDEILSLTGLSGKQVRRLLIYLTMDCVMPKVDVAASEAIIQKNLKIEDREIYWLSWRTFYGEIQKWNPLNKVDQKIKADILHYFLRKGIQTFQGFHLSELDNLNPFYQTSKSQTITSQTYFSSLASLNSFAGFYQTKGVEA